MSPAQEQQVGAQEHQNIAKTYQIQETGYPVQDYVRSVGNIVARNTERPDVRYKFYVLDTPDVNAFALPGGYVYVTRGLLAYANSEAELAGVLGHEIGHITARHSAERYSRAVLTSLGAAVVSAALDSSTASQALGVGSDLYIKSYSRGQEHEADQLGIRYLYRNGYDPMAMSSFLTNLNAHTKLENLVQGRGEGREVDNYFSTHPQTGDRINQTIAQAGQYGRGADKVGRIPYLKAIDGIVYGDSAREGFLRDHQFIHTDIGFTFEIPDGFTLLNQKTQIVASHSNGTVIIVDSASNPNSISAYNFLREVWMKGETVDNPERVTVNGMNAATASFQGKVNGRNATVRLMAIEWSPTTIFRFQIAIPRGASPQLVEGLKTTTYSFRRLTAKEKRDIKPYRLRVVTALEGDTVASLAARMPVDDFSLDRFRVLNGLGKNDPVIAGQQYKIISAN